MSKTKLEIGVQSDPRFEFRTFGRAFDNAAFRMARLSVPVPEKVWERRSSEVYIVSATNDVNNTKIRDGKMDIKTFVQEKQGLEQWNPLMKGEFPIAKDLLVKEVFPAFQVDMPALSQNSYTLEEFLTMIRATPELQAVRVEKQRFGYMINDAVCETANVWINGAGLFTLSCESTVIEDILKTLDEVGLKNEENINYLQAIKRVIGMIDKPLAN